MGSGTSRGPSLPARASLSPAVTRAPSNRMPINRWPAGGLTATEERPWFSISKSVSHSVMPDGWHQQVVSSAQTQARASSSLSRLPGRISAAGNAPVAVGPAGGIKNSANICSPGPALASAGPGGSSASMWLTTRGRRRPALRTLTSPSCLSVPSTHASGIGTPSVNGSVRTARTLTGSRTGGVNSIIHDSPVSVADRSVASSELSARRTAKAALAGGRSDHSNRSFIGSEKCTTNASRSDVSGRHSNVNASVRRSSRAVSRTCVRATSGGRWRSKRPRNPSPRPPPGIQTRTAPSSIKRARRGTVRSGGGTSPSSTTVVSGLVLQAISTRSSASPSKRTISSSAQSNDTPVATPARCPAMRSLRLAWGSTARVNPMLSMSPCGSRTTFHSSGWLMPALPLTATRSLAASPAAPSTASTESINQPWAIRPPMEKAAPRRTLTSQADRPSSPLLATSTVVTRATSTSGRRGSIATRSEAPAPCSSTATRAGGTC